MKKGQVKRVIFRTIGIILGIIVIVPVVIILPYYFRVQHFEAQPQSGYHADFYLYLSPKAERLAKQGKPITILVQPNNSGNSDDPEFHRKDAWWMGFGRHKLANHLGVGLLIPAFVRPSEDWHIYSHALDRDVFTTDREDMSRIDLQLLKMIETAQSDLSNRGFPVRDQVLLQGYSASGMFANRFAALHPDRILAVGAGSPGGWAIVPLSIFEETKLPYPIGIGDIKELTGHDFDTLNYKKMPQLIVMGSADTNDALDYTDGWDTEHAALVDSLFGDTPLKRWSYSERLYSTANANAEFLLVKDIGHDRKALQSYTTQFFKEILEKL